MAWIYYGEHKIVSITAYDDLTTRCARGAESAEEDDLFDLPASGS
jgi:hypothetical protein